MTVRQRQPRIAEPKYLAWLRKQGCACGCGSPPPSDAAHLRAGSVKYDKRPTGLQEKPSDCWAMPLKHAHHMAQHAFGSEQVWWEQHGIDPFVAAKRYHAAYLAEMPTKASAEPAGASARKPSRKAKPRPKASQRPRAAKPWGKKPGKISSRPFPTGRKFQRGR